MVIFWLITLGNTTLGDTPFYLLQFEQKMVRRQIGEKRLSRAHFCITGKINYTLLISPIS